MRSNIDLIATHYELATADKTKVVIVGASKTFGSAGNAQAIQRYLDQGVTYLYTHLTALMSSGAETFFNEVGP